MVMNGLSSASVVVATVLALTGCQQPVGAGRGASGHVSAAHGRGADPAAAAVEPIAASAGATPDPFGRRRADPASSPGQSGRYLPAESKLLRGNAMSVEATRSALMFEGFDASMAEFAAQAARDPNARDLSARYRAAILRQLGGSGMLVDLQCGLSLCMGTIRTKDRAAMDAWVDRFGQSADTPNFVFTRFAKKRASGEFDNRFVFSSDPGANSATSRR
ncbi:hypothetical protein [Lysobacter enzymogenes]|uniref:Lipoprotein n=1 Tax=Lysobacter enzymogenes TaxID=69 RepID=A0AAU9APU9_LYSEN|nr:hypothetical protein [Lysobacter enzymogenes]BAV99319.1 conserved hypothetical protein [Lysobacter enzymogenes]